MFNRLNGWWLAVRTGTTTAIRTLKQDRLMVAAMIVGALILYGGLLLSIHPDLQTRAYNAGLQAYKKESQSPEGSMGKAVKLFEGSLVIYKAGEKGPWLDRFIYPYPSKELAARANFHKAKAHLLSGQAELSVDSFQESLRLNPGNVCKDLVWEDFVRLRDSASTTKYDLEQLYKARPDLAQAQGKNKGKKPGQQGEPDPAHNPASGAGKGNRDDI